MEFTELIPGLPEEIALECLARVHYSLHHVSSQVCKRWSRLLQTSLFYYHRKRNGFTHQAACFVQALPEQKPKPKPSLQPRYGISLFDPDISRWERVDPIPKYPDGLPLFCQLAGTEGKLVLMGGWGPSNWEPVRDVFVYEFTTRRWIHCTDMPSTRSFFAIGAAGGKVFVAGGHDGGKNALSSAWVFDVRRNEWSELEGMSEERDECDGVVVGGEFWVVSGYGTETQGAFKSSADVYDIGSGRWRRVEDARRVNRCQRSAAVHVGTSGEEGAAALVTACTTPHGFYLIKEGNVAVKLDVPDEYVGTVQSGCCVEI